MLHREHIAAEALGLKETAGRVDGAHIGLTRERPQNLHGRTSILNERRLFGDHSKGEVRQMR